MKKYSVNSIELINDLHSQRLSECYGEISLEVLKQEGLIRITYLKDKENIVRTIAITLFSDKLYSSELSNIHRQIIAGNFIGETIRSHDFDIIKRIKGKFKLITSEHSVFNQRDFLFGQLSEIFVSKNAKKEEYYAEVCEIYDSDFNQKYSGKFDSMNNPELVIRIERILKHAKFGNFKITLIS